MAFNVVYPRPGTNAKPTILPRTFVVYGTKDTDTDKYFGVIAREVKEKRPGNPAVTTTQFFGGEYLDPDKFKKRGADDQFGQANWAIRFTLPANIRRKERLTLYIIKGDSLLAATPGNPVFKATVANIAIQGGNKTSVGRGQRDVVSRSSIMRSLDGSLPIFNLFSAEFPIASTEMSRTSPIAYGYLVGANTDIDTAQIAFIRSDDETVVNPPDWVFVEPVTGFWLAIFPDMSNTSTWPGTSKVKLLVVYTPDGDEEIVENISLV